MNLLYYSLLLLFVLLALFLILLVLIQKGRGGGLSAAFGGVGGNTAFGAKTGDVLTWATSVVFGIFLLLAIGLNLIGNRIHAEAINPYAKPAVVPATAPADLTPAPVDRSPIVLPTATPTIPAAAIPATGPSAPNPTPTPPPTPTTKPSTRPTANITLP